MFRGTSYLVLVAFAISFSRDVVSTFAQSDGRVQESSYDINGSTNGGNWSLHGSAKVSETGIELTQKPWERGSIWFAESMNFSNWELELDFEIRRSEEVSVHADGFGLFYVQDRQHGDTFGTIPRFVGLGIVLDTYCNKCDKRRLDVPVLQAHVLDGSLPYDGGEDGIPTALVNLRAPLLDKTDSKLLVKYFNSTLTVVLKHRIDTESEWATQEFGIENVQLPKGYYLGLGAACGLYCSNHRVIGLKVFSLDGPDHGSTSLPRVNSETLFQDNEFFRWNSLVSSVAPSSGVVLGYSMDASPVFFARVPHEGRIVPALYIPGLNNGKLYALVDGQVVGVEVRHAQMLSYRYSRSTHLLWERYSSTRLESGEFKKRLLAVGHSNEWDVLYICRSEPGEHRDPSGHSSTSGLGVVSISSGVCQYVEQIDSERFEMRATSRFSMAFTLPEAS